jgi:outer membrane protein assembly factor BamC
VTASLRRIGHRAVLAALVGVLAAGCSVTETINEATRIDYRSAGKKAPLDIPPDLVTPRGDNRFDIPESGRAATTFSDFSRDRETQKPVAGTAPGVLPQPAGVRIERQGNQRWLVVEQTPDRVWPVVREFWGDSGFVLRIESPETGIMETDWAENRARVPDSWVRNQLTRFLGSIYSTAERDKYRTRLESNGKFTEVFVSHRGLTEEFSGPQKDTTVWVPRPSDPELEAEFLRRLMLRFTPQAIAGAAPAPASATATASAPAGGGAAAPPARAVLVEEEGQSFVQLQDEFDRAWRQVGLALDRSGFTVEDRDRSKGTYFVRYVDPDQEVKAASVLNRVFGTGTSKDLSGKRYRIEVVSRPPGSRVAVLTDDGSPPTTEADRRVANRIASILRDQLR